MVGATPAETRCPQCGVLSVYSIKNPSRPFCSDRCKLIDLGAWASGRYSIAGSPLDAPLVDDGDSSVERSH